LIVIALDLIFACASGYFSIAKAEQQLWKQIQISSAIPLCYEYKERLALSIDHVSA
jgi:hypothetical protein